MIDTTTTLWNDLDFTYEQIANVEKLFTEYIRRETVTMYTTPYILMSYTEVMLYGGEQTNQVAVLDYYEDEKKFLVETVDGLFTATHHEIKMLYNSKVWNRKQYVSPKELQDLDEISW